MYTEEFGNRYKMTVSYTRPEEKKKKKGGGGRSEREIDRLKRKEKSIDKQNVTGNQQLTVLSLSLSLVSVFVYILAKQHIFPTTFTKVHKKKKVQS